MSQFASVALYDKHGKTVCFTRAEIVDGKPVIEKSFKNDGAVTAKTMDKVTDPAEIAQLIDMDLENANRHSMPSAVKLETQLRSIVGYHDRVHVLRCVGAWLDC
jgi:hypothetical protein